MDEDVSEGRVVILVGHGAPPRGYRREAVARLKALEGRRQATGGSMGDEEAALDRQIRAYPRTAENDPYREGILALAAALAPRLGGAQLLVAYNEFCGPSVEEAVEDAVRAGAQEIVVVPSMLTPGGVHAEVEIPEALARARARFPGLKLRYAWPFDLELIATMLAVQVGAGTPAAP
jgi:sirohydrochlorin cobaltochelatase